MKNNKQIFNQKLLRIFILINVLLLSSVFAYSQNMVKNWSFEDTLWQPTNISTPLLDQLTRSLGDYDLTQYPNGTYPNRDYRHHTKNTSPNGGCDGWYNPSGSATPDYYNRNVPYVWQQKKVSVPRNRSNNWGVNTNSDIQEPFDDNGNGVINTGTEDSYIGLQMVRDISTWPWSSDQYAEYATQRLADPDNPLDLNYLKHDGYYHIKFHVSLALGDTNFQDIPTGHALKSMKAYFTSANNPFQQNQATPTDLPDNTFDLIGTFSTTSGYLDQTGGTNGTNWMTVEGNYHPAEDKYFITLGNFQADWAPPADRINGPDPSLSDDWIKIYYFIDAVEITELPPEQRTCFCYDSLETPLTHELITKPILKQIEDTNCCTEIYMYTSKNYWNLCHTSIAKVYQLTGPYRNIEEHLFDYDNLAFFQPGDTVKLGEICLNKLDAVFQQYLRIKLFDGNQFICNLEAVYMPQCLCSCEDTLGQDRKFNIKLIDLTDSQDSVCCWDIGLKDSSDCKISAKYFQFSVNPSDEQYINVSEIGGMNEWTLQHTNGTGIYTFINPVEYIMPDPDDWLIIGKICMTRGAPSVNYNLTYDLPPQFDTLSCPRIWPGVLSCKNCCDSLGFQWGPYSVLPPTYCCRWVQLTDFNSPCSVWGWKIDQLGCCSAPPFVLDSIIEPNNQSGKNPNNYQYEFCPVMCDTLPFRHAELRIRVTYYLDGIQPPGAGRTCVVEHCLDTACTPAFGRMALSDFETPSKIVSGNIIHNFTIIPNPASDETKISFRLTEPSGVILELYNVLGEKIDLLMNSDMNKGLHYYDYNTSGLTPGIYFFRIKAQENILGIPLTIIK